MTETSRALLFPNCLFLHRPVPTFWTGVRRIGGSATTGVARFDLPPVPRDRFDAAAKARLLPMFAFETPDPSFIRRGIVGSLVA